MNTKNHKPATTSDILNTASNNPPSEGVRPTNPQIHQSNNLFALRARCGKVARLPKEIRDQINEMLLDGIPHIQIIQKLRQTFAAPASPQPSVLPLDTTDASSNPAPSDSGHESRITH